MDTLTLFGLFAVTAMLLFYALEDHSRWFILAFAAACALASVYGFLQGAWPFGMVEAIWTVVALQRWRTSTTLADYSRCFFTPIHIRQFGHCSGFDRMMRLTMAWRTAGNVG